MVDAGGCWFWWKILVTMLVMDDSCGDVVMMNDPV
jgi:hypothetical protein